MAGFGHNNGPEWSEEERGESQQENAFKEAKRELEGLSVEELLQRGHESLLRELVARAHSGTITHQEMAVLRNILRDNGMILGLPLKGLPQQAHPSVEDLPELDPPEYPQ